MNAILIKVTIVVVCVVGYLLLAGLIKKIVRELGARKSVADVRVNYICRTADIVLFVGFLTLALLSLGLGYNDISLFLSSIFAVMGVALFAQWSILSNVTGSVIIFFAFPYRVGNSITVIDGDNSVSGVIEEITLFHVLIRDVNGDLLTYPNSLILQKPVIKREFNNHDVLP